MRPWGCSSAGLTFALCLSLLSGCSAPYEEHFFNPYHNVSGPAGTVIFVPSAKLRDCTWFECGESGHKWLGAAVDSLLLRENARGGLELVRLARIDCAAEQTDACDTASAPPQLRRGPKGLVLVNNGSGPVDSTIAWSGMRGFELTETTWLCVDAALPLSIDAILLKVSPAADMSRVAEVAYALRRPPPGQEAKRCFSTRGLPRPESGSKRLFLTDVLRDARGRFEIAYVAAENIPAVLTPAVSLIALDDGGWKATELPAAAYGPETTVSLMPGLFDTSGRLALLDMEIVYRSRQVDVRLLNRETAAARQERVALPEPE